MTNRENLIAALEGRVPERIPYTTYADFGFNEPGLSRLKSLGFAEVQYTGVIRETPEGFEREKTECVSNGKKIETITLRTPAGSISQTSVNGWVQEYFLKEPSDYRAMEYVVRNTRQDPDYARFHTAEQLAGENGVTLIWARRTPMQTMLVDYAGLERFFLHLADAEPEVMALYEALLDQWLDTCRIIAAGPGCYVSLLENLTAETWGPAKFTRYHMPAYEKGLPILHAGGKKIYAHFDGRLASIAPRITETPIDGIESFTIAPEGDMNYEGARDAWPDMFIWSNISLSVYALPEKDLRAWVRKAVKDCAPDGRNFALAVLEDVPPDWERKMPVILDTLRALYIV